MKLEGNAGDTLPNPDTFALCLREASFEGKGEVRSCVGKVDAEAAM